MVAGPVRAGVSRMAASRESGRPIIYLPARDHHAPTGLPPLSTPSRPLGVQSSCRILPMPKGTSPVYGFGPFVLDVTDRSLKRDGAAIPLTPKQFDLLVALVESAGRLVEKDVLLQRVWPDVAVEEGNLTKGVFSLRQVLDRDAPARYIETIPKRGYRFVAPVTAVSPGLTGPAVAEATAHEASENSIAVLPFADMSAARDHEF